jgi:hypothetical protein
MSTDRGIGGGEPGALLAEQPEMTIAGQHQTVAGTGYFALFSKSLSRWPRLSIFAEWLSRRPTRRFEF